MLDSTLESESQRQLLGQPPGELALRVCGGPRAGHVVRLTAPRCSIGSSDRCTLRLRGPGIRPLHCVILRGAERTVVRRWSPDTLLNGRDFADAALELGDQITIGPILFEVVPADSVSSPTTAWQGMAGELPRDSASTSPAVQQELDQRAAELARREADLLAREADVQRQQQVLSEAQQQIQAERDATALAQSRTQEQLDRLRAQLETERASLRRQTDDDLAQQTRRSAELDALAEDLAARASRLDRQETQRGSRQDDIGGGGSAGQDSYRSAADAVYAGAADSMSQADDLRFEPVSEEAPTSAAAVLQRIGAAPSDDIDAPTSDFGSSGEQYGPSPTTTTRDDRDSTAAAAESDDDESVKEYMARLMERVGGKQDWAAAPAPTVARSTPRQPQPDAAPQARPAPPPVEDKPKLQKLERRSAPELSADLSRMRALANENARTVLDDHFRRKLYYMTIGKASVAIAALVAGLLLLWWSTHGAPIAFYLATISFAVTAIWMLQYAIAVGYLIRGRSKPENPSRQADADETPTKRTTKRTADDTPSQAAAVATAPGVDAASTASGAPATAETELADTIVLDQPPAPPSNQD